MHIIDQQKVGVIFIFQQRNIEMIFQAQRKDGSRITHEQWCDFHQKKGKSIYYTFEDEADQFFRSNEFKQLKDKYSNFN